MKRDVGVGIFVDMLGWRRVEAVEHVRSAAMSLSDAWSVASRAAMLSAPLTSRSSR